MNHFTFTSARVITVTCVLLVLGTMSCSSPKGDGEPCDCSAGVEIQEEKILEGQTLPNDLTCVVANSGTMRVIIEELEAVYNRTFEANVHLSQEDERWIKLQTEISDWLGGPYVGDCGNLIDGLKIKGYDELGERMDIEIKAVKVELNRENGRMEKAPFWYQGYTTFSVSISTKTGRAATGFTAKNNIVIATCNRYSAMYEKDDE